MWFLSSLSAADTLAGTIFAVTDRARCAVRFVSALSGRELLCGMIRRGHTSFNHQGNFNSRGRAPAFLPLESKRRRKNAPRVPADVIDRTGRGRCCDLSASMDFASSSSAHQPSTGPHMAVASTGGCNWEVRGEPRPSTALEIDSRAPGMPMAARTDSRNLSASNAGSVGLTVQRPPCAGAIRSLRFTQEVLSSLPCILDEFVLLQLDILLLLRAPGRLRLFSQFGECSHQRWVQQRGAGRHARAAIPG